MTNWIDCEKPKDCAQWITPPACEGQIVRVSYTGPTEHGVVFRRTWDQNDGSRKYAKRFLTDSEEFEPWHTEPV